MNCSSCKNPINSNAILCEWCGNTIEKNDQIKYSNSGEIQVTLRFSGIWFLDNPQADVFVDDYSIGTVSMKKGGGDILFKRLI